MSTLNVTNRETVAIKLPITENESFWHKMTELNRYSGLFELSNMIQYRHRPTRLVSVLFGPHYHPRLFSISGDPP